MFNKIKLRASSSYPRVRLWQISLLSELAHEEKSHTQSFTHSPSLYDAPGTQACASENYSAKHTQISVTYTNHAIKSAEVEMLHIS